jgi:alanyl-tRNA synthetase
VTHRLYYDDPYRVEFDADIVRVEARGDRLAVWLDQTTFYPTSGGQPFDTGVLASSRVVDVADDDGEVVHVVAPSAPLAAGQRVHGRVDWTRRFDHMQQHTGQHVLSAAIARLFGVRTVSFHLGTDITTIDLARELTPAEIARAEDEANQVVWEDRPVTIRYASAEDAAAMPLRKEPARGGKLRIIEVEQFDLSACGGTHVRRTGAIGIIAVAGWERFKGGHRLDFVCGGRALSRFRALRDTTSAAIRLLSVLPAEVPAAIERLQVEVKEQKRGISTLRSELARYRAAELAGEAERQPLGRVVLRVVDGDANALKAIALAITASPGFVVVLVSQDTPAVVVAARSGDIEVSCADIVNAIAGQFGGRGGGKPDLAQAGGLGGAAQAVLDASRALLERRSAP